MHSVSRFLAATLIFASSAACFAAPATITNTTEDFNTAKAFIPGNYGARQTDCRAPYQRMSNGEMVWHTWDKVVLENEFIRVDVLPGLGGRVLRFINKTTGNNEFYHNPAGFKHNSWGRIGWSATGGTEVMFPLDEHHGPFYLPWDDGPGNNGKPWLIESHEGTIPNGVRLTMVIDEDTHELYNAPNSRFRLECMIELKDDEAAFSQSFILRNKRNNTEGIELWSNSMISPGPGNMTVSGDNLNQHIVFPKAVTQVYDHNDNGRMGPGTSLPFETLNWPIHNGQDISNVQTFYNQNYGYMGAFVANGVDVTFGGVYNLSANEGMIKTFPAQIAPGVDTGLKSWHWGKSGITEFGEGNSTYIEIMSGPCTVFQADANCTFGSHPTGQAYRVDVPAQSSLEWTDTYIAPRAINNVVHSTNRVVMNFNAPSSSQDGFDLPLTVGVYPTRPQTNARIFVTIGGVEIWAWQGPVGPGANPAPFYQTPVPHLSTIPLGNQPIALNIRFDDATTESYSQPIFISPNPSATATPAITNTPATTPTPTNTPTATPTLAPPATPTPTGAPPAVVRVLPNQITLHHPPFVNGSNPFPAFDISVINAQSLISFALTVAWNPALLSVASANDVTLGSFLGSGGSTIMPGTPQINNIAGTVSYNALASGPGYATGNGPLAHIRWTTHFVAQTTQTTLSITSLNLVENGLSRTPITETANVRICFYADIDCNNLVDIVDIQQVAGVWNSFPGDGRYNRLLDVDKDNDVDIQDLQLVAGRWGQTAPFQP